MEHINTYRVIRTLRRVAYLWCFFCALVPHLHAYNPQPEKGDFTLPMPHGGSMVFRRIFIGEGDNPFFLRQFDMGEPGNNYKENLTRIGIGGAFLQPQLGQKDWFYYIGKYEVTEVQYDAIMGSDMGSKPPADLASHQYPKRNLSWFDAQEFIHKYNLWLFQHHLDQLPRNAEAIGFLRLPTEAEWEFAARGGIAVSTEQFQARHPYKDILSKHEWFSGPESSHDKVRPTGVIAPNALFLHDMLGNVSEMTASFYQVEYYQGRVGGFVARGGNFTTSESSVRVSLRIEQPLYAPPPKSTQSATRLSTSNSNTLVPQTSPTLGLRLLISSVISTGLGSDRLKQDWEAYRSSRLHQDSPASLSKAPPATQTNLQLAQVGDFVNQLLTDPALTPPSKRQLEILQASLGNIEATVKQADVNTALAWVRMATSRGHAVADGLKRLPLTQQALETAKRASTNTAIITKWQNNLQTLQHIIDETLREYADSIHQLAQNENVAQQQAFAKYLAELTRKGDVDRIKVFNQGVKPHLQQYIKEQRADMGRWKTDFEKL